MQKRKSSPQEIYLNQLRKHQTSVYLYLLNGARITGKIEAFDLHTIIFNSDNRQQLINKRGIISIVPRHPKTDIYKTKQIEPVTGANG